MNKNNMISIRLIKKLAVYFKISQILTQILVRNVQNKNKWQVNIQLKLYKNLYRKNV